MNKTVETILAHRSVRNFEEKRLTSDQIETIVKSAQAASTSSYVQAYSIIGVTDGEKKRKLAKIAGEQEYVAQNGHLFIFCADLYRHEVIGEMEGVDVVETLESTEKLMVALIDTALAAQNAAIAAESMGLGICYIGGIRNNLQKVCELLNTPKRVIPLFGLAVGYPKELKEQKPRLPFEHVYHENGYSRDIDRYKAQLMQYNETVRSYYENRSSGKRTDTWTRQMAKMLGRKVRLYMRDFLFEKGLNRR